MSKNINIFFIDENKYLKVMAPVSDIYVYEWDKHKSDIVCPITVIQY